MGRTNRRWEPTAAGKGGAECTAAARLMRAIQELISLAVLRTERPSVGPVACPALTSPALTAVQQRRQDSEPHKARSPAASRMVDLFLIHHRGKSRKATDFISNAKNTVSDFLEFSVQNQEAALDLRGIDMQAPRQRGPWAQGRGAGGPASLCSPRRLPTVLRFAGQGGSSHRGRASSHQRRPGSRDKKLEPFCLSSTPDSRCLEEVEAPVSSPQLEDIWLLGVMGGWRGQ